MKITDISIESNNIEITVLSKQEAHKVVGGDNFALFNAGVPRTGGTYEESCYLAIFSSQYYEYDS